MNVKVLTWNIGGKTRDDAFILSIAQEILAEQEPDIIILQEYNNDAFAVALEQYVPMNFDYLSGRGIRKAVRVFVTKRIDDNSDRYTVGNNNKFVGWELNLGDRLNFFAVHMYSKAQSKIEQDELNRQLILGIEEYEQLSGHRNTVIVGDLNHGPFDVSMINPLMFSAVGSRKLVTDLSSRHVAGKNRRMFYNPMWNKLGDFDVRKGEVIPGTYFRSAPAPDEYYWNCLDGVLLSASMAYKIDLTSLEIVTKNVAHEVLTDNEAGTNKPTYFKQGMSDHFPVVFTLKL